MFQEAPRGIADRVLLGLIPTSERSWPTACACLKPTSGGWLHIHINVDTRHLRDQLLCDSQCQEDKTSQTISLSEHQATIICNHLDVPSNSQSRELLWGYCADEVASKIASILLNTHRKPWRVTIGHIECVKSYAPHVDHIVIDLECRPELL